MSLFPNKPWMFKKQIQNDTFGRIWYNKDKNPKFNHYQGHTLLKPINKMIDVFIDSDKKGIDINQELLFQEIENNYLVLIDKLVEPTENKLTKRKCKTIKVNDFISDFELFAIQLHRHNTNHKKFSLSFESETYGIIGLTYEFENFELISISG